VPPLGQSRARAALARAAMVPPGSAGVNGAIMIRLRARADRAPVMWL
jgi:hypothetical protein